MPRDTSHSTMAVRNVSAGRIGIENLAQCYQCKSKARMPAAVKLNICAIASEVVPFAKSGGLADVASALSRQLTVAGHDVRLFIPFYSRIKRDSLRATRVE